MPRLDSRKALPIVWISHQIRRMNMVKNTMLNRLNELPRLSKVLQELLDMANQPDVDFHQLSKKSRWIKS